MMDVVGGVDFELVVVYSEHVISVAGGDMDPKVE